MGELIHLDEWRIAARRPIQGSPPLFYFDLSCPFSYLAAERIERLLGQVGWVPVAGAARERGRGSARPEAVRGHAERLARSLRLPLVWPDRFPEPVPGAMRAAAYTAETGAAVGFALAASRLAFCGGFDLEDPEVLAEAAAAAGVSLRGCLAAAGDAARDESLQATARLLATRGVRQLPVIRIGRRWFEGDQAPVDAAALLRAESAYRRPLAPVG